MDLHTLFTDVPPELSFLIADPKRTAALHAALLDSTEPVVRAALETCFTESTLVSVLRFCYSTIDPEGFSEAFSSALAPGTSVSGDQKNLLDSLLSEKETLLKQYPLYVGTDRPIHQSMDNEFLPSSETLLLAMMHSVPQEIIAELNSRSDGLLSRMYTKLAQTAGFDSLSDAECFLDAAAYDADFTDSPCSGE